MALEGLDPRCKLCDLHMYSSKRCIYNDSLLGYINEYSTCNGIITVKFNWVVGLIGIDFDSKPIFSFTSDYYQCT